MATDAPRLLVVEHEQSCPPAQVGDWLADEGVELDVRRPYRGDPLPADLTGHAGLLVLGGRMGAYDDAMHPWLTRVKSLVRDGVDRGTPVWGICLGHQLVTAALGGEVQLNPAGRATGLTPVRWTEAAADDALCAVVRRDAVVVQWNNDIATRLPSEAVLLARSPDGSPQAVRFADRCWGVQFHPEADGDVFALWAASARERDPGDTSADRALDAIRSHDEVLRRTWRPMAKAFAAQLG